MRIPDYTAYAQLASFAKASKTEQRKQIAEDTERFLANGGTITEIPYDPTHEIMARVGQWNAMGEMTFVDVDDDDFSSSVSVDLFDSYS